MDMSFLRIVLQQIDAAHFYTLLNWMH